MRTEIRAGLASQLDAKLVDELLDAHAEAKRNFFLGGLRLAEVEGGRFCEAAFRLLEHITTGRHTQLNRKLDTDKLIETLRNLSTSAHNESIRLHIPRSLRLVYDIRNNRDAAHLADGIDPNMQDATLVVGVLDWVLSEFIRLYHSVPADEARAIVEAIVTRAAPVIQDFDGFLKVLNPRLSASDHCLVLLYQRGESGARLEQLLEWARPPMRANLRRTLQRLVNERALVHFDGAAYVITNRGKQEVERNHLIEPV
jgi:hypothetical protein